MSERFSNGDRVRHVARPEWGVGTVTKVEAAQGVQLNGHAPQRLSIRFPNAGLKTLVTGHAELARVNDGNDPFADGESPVVQYWESKKDTDWLAPMAKKKVEEAMMSLPPDVKDPFNSIQKRLTIMLGLYRFDRSGRGLMDWAVAQTGLDDPLSSFNRTDLEQKFDRWVFERDNYLAKLIQEARVPGIDPGGTVLRNVLQTAPPAAQHIVRRLIASR